MFSSSRFPHGSILFLCAAFTAPTSLGCGQGSDSKAGDGEPSPSVTEEERSSEDMHGLRLELIESIQRRASPLYQITHVKGRAHAISAVNSKHAFTSQFSPTGVWIGTHDMDSAQVSLRLSGVRCADGVKRVEDATPHGRKNRVEYARKVNGVGAGAAPITEWFVNGPLGLEQGITLAEAPCPAEPAGAKETVLEIALSTTLKTALMDGWVQLSTPDGQTAFSYGGVYAKDASGKVLPVTLSLDEAGEKVALHVQTEGAQWPVVVDPLVTTQQAQLSQDLGAAGDGFGAAVTVKGNSAFVGIPFNDVGGNSNQGSVFWFTRNADNVWSLKQQITLSTGAANDEFGSAVAYDGTTLVIGARGTAVGGVAGKGAAYVCTIPPLGSSFSVDTQLLVSLSAANDHFGTSVSVDGTYIAVGAADADSGGTDIGAAYVFFNSGSSWGLQQKLLVASGAAAGDHLGQAIAISGSSVLVGAPYHDPSGHTDWGGAYLFTRSGTTWTQQKEFVITDGTTTDHFGASVALEGTTALIGAPNQTVGALTGRGAAYAYTGSGASWTSQGKLTAADGQASDALATSVALSGDTAVLGVPQRDTGLMSNHGGVYVFVRSITEKAWVQQGNRLEASDRSANDRLGSAVALDGDTAFQASQFDTIEGSANEGSAYAFVRSGTTWSQQQKLTPTFGHSSDQLGYAVSESGDTIVVGAPNETSQGYAGLGAVYVFVRSGTTWSLQTRLVPALTGFFGTETPYANVDNLGFGTSVSLQGDRLVIGAPGARNSSSVVTGGVWVYDRTGTSWSRTTRLFPTGASSTGAPHFGSSVSLDGSTIGVGAKDEFIGSLTSAGSGYVFVLSSGTWSQQARLTASDAGYMDQFGTAVAVRGDVFASGSPNHLEGGLNNRGVVYAATRTGTTWSALSKLPYSGGAAGDHLGAALAFGDAAGASLLVGAPNASSSRGAALLYSRSGSTWTQGQTLTLAGGVSGDGFGTGVSLGTDLLVVGAPGADISVNTNQGAAYVFTKWTGTWTYQTRLTASDGLTNDGFGSAVGSTQSSAVVGAALDDRDMNINQGSAYVFGLSRSNGDPCSSTAECQSGFCVSGVCCNTACSGQCDACTVATGASVNGTCTGATGRSCTDGNACTTGDTCNAASVCQGTAVNIDDNNVCTSDSCNTSTGAISHAPLTGPSCNDNNACTANDTCQAGVCTGPALNCNDNNACTTDSCNAATGCAHPILADGASCGAGQVCASGSCASDCFIGGVLYAAGTVNPSNACQACTPSSSTTAWSTRANGTSCSDGNACTGNDTCQSGVCTASYTVMCPLPFDGCHVQGVCDPASGCSHPVAPAGTSCSDGNTCNGAEACDANGTCLAGTAPVLDDHNPCTVDACDSVLGVTHVPGPAGVDCSSGNPCDGPASCNKQGHCIAYPPSIDDGNDCTIDACSPSTGVTHTPKTAGIQCNDSNACTTGETCNGSGACVGTATTAPAPSGACVDVTCDPTTGAFSEAHRVDATCCPSAFLFDRTVATTVDKSSQYLFDCGIQQGYTPSFLQRTQAAVIRGHIHSRGGAPIYGVKVSVLDHPEFGWTTSRVEHNAGQPDDAVFELAVNGGHSMTLGYKNGNTTFTQGYLPAQRTVDVPVQGQIWAPDVVLIDVAPAVPGASTLTMDASHTIATTTPVKGQATSDEDGTRQPRLMFKAGTMMKRNGTVLVPPNGTVTFRSNEFTVGRSGLDAMPGTIPPASQYTFATEFSLDEFSADGSVSFENTNTTVKNTVVAYMENFLHIPPGVVIPVGHYDTTTGTWKADPEGAVIRVMRSNGSYKFDLDNRVPANPADDTFETDQQLDDFGIDAEERAHVGSVIGDLIPNDGDQVLVWRVPMAHFTGTDWNFGAGYPNDATNPNGGPPSSPDVSNEQTSCGSIIGCFRQTLGERFPVTGTGYTLAYQSERAPGYKGGASLHIPMSGGSIPKSVIDMRATVDVAGYHTVQHFGPGKNVAWDFTWPGVGGNGQRLVGSQVAAVTVAWGYPIAYGNYIAVGSLGGGGGGGGPGGGVYKVTDINAFANPGYPPSPEPETFPWQPPGSNEPARLTTTLYAAQSWYSVVSPQVFDYAKLGGLTLDVHHSYDAIGRVLNLGSGGRVSAENLGSIVANIANASVNDFGSMAADAYGNVYMYSGASTSAGTVFSTAGCTGSCPSATINDVNRLDSTPGDVFFPFSGARALAMAANGDLLIGTGNDASFAFNDCKLARIHKSGTHWEGSSIAGLENVPSPCGFSTDGTVARGHRIGQVSSIASTADGSIYFVENTSNVRRIAPDGRLSTVVLKNPEWGDPGPSGQTFNPYQIAAGPDGTLFVLMHYVAIGADGWKVVGLRPSGTFYTVVEFNTQPQFVVGSNRVAYASNADHSRIRLAVQQDGTLYFSSTGCVRSVNGIGNVGLVAGTEESCVPSAPLTTFAPAGYAAATPIVGAPLIAVGPDKDLFYQESYFGDGRLRHVRSMYPGLGLSDVIVLAGGEQFVFDLDGRHLATRDAVTGKTIRTFGYTSHSLSSTPPINELLLTSIQESVEGTGHATIIHRNSNGVATSIESSFGQVTTLDVATSGNDEGLLHSITDPAGKSTHFAYGSSGPFGLASQYGLLTSLVDPRGNEHLFTYDPTNGRLLEDSDPETTAASTYFKKLTLTSGTDPTLPGDPPHTDVVSMEKAMGGSADYKLQRTPSSDIHERQEVDVHLNGSAANDLVSSSELHTDGTSVSVSPDGTETTTTLGPDVRWGMLSPIVKTSRVSTGSRAVQIDRTQTVSPTTLSTPTAFTSLTETISTSACDLSACSADTSVSTTLTHTTLNGASVDKVDTTTGAGNTSTVYLGTSGSSQGQPVLMQRAGLIDVSMTYDDFGRPKTITQGGRTRTYDYVTTANASPSTGLQNGALRSISQSGAAGPAQTVFFTTDLIGRIISQELPSDVGQPRELLMSYDDTGNLTSLTPPGRSAHIWDATESAPLAYDGNNQPLVYNPPTVTSQGVPVADNTHYSYDLDRRLSQIDLPTGESIIPDYDLAGRPTSITLSSGSTITTTYVPAKDLVDHVSAAWSEVAGDATETISFQHEGALVSEIDISGTNQALIAYGHDDAMRVLSEKIGKTPSFHSVSLVRGDLDKRVTAMQAGSSELSFAYTPGNGFLAGTTLSSTDAGVVSLSMTMSNVDGTASRSGYGEVDQIAFTRGASSLFNETVIARDGLGRIKTLHVSAYGTVPAITYDYTYDGAGRLWGVYENGLLKRSYEYDANGNRLYDKQYNTSGTVISTTSATHDGQDRMLTHGTASYEYTADGRLKKKTDGSAVTQYTYDVLGNLRQVHLPSGSTVTYTIDPMNRRIARNDGTGLKQRLVFSGLHPVAQLNDAGTDWKRHFVYGARGHVPEVMYEKNGSTVDVYRLITDHLGSLRMVVKLDAAGSPTVVQTMSYDEWGNVDATTDWVASGFERVPFGYAGGLYDRDTKLTRFGARDYDAQSGRWTAKDPIGFRGRNTMLFGYCSGDPLNCVDPSGKSGILTLWVIEHEFDIFDPLEQGHVFVSFDKDGTAMGPVAWGSYPYRGHMSDTNRIPEATISWSEWIDDEGEQRYEDFVRSQNTDSLAAWGPWGSQGTCGNFATRAFEAGTGNFPNYGANYYPGAVGDILRQGYADYGLAEGVNIAIGLDAAAFSVYGNGGM